MVIPGVAPVSLGSTTVAANIDHYAMVVVDTPIIVDQIACEVTTGVAANFRIGVYSANLDLQPIGAPLADSGNIDATSPGVKTYTPGTPIYMRRGRYLSVVNTASSSIGLRFYQGHVPSGYIDSTLGNAPWFDSLRIARAYAAFPTPGSAWTTEGGAKATPPNHYVFYRVLTP